MSTRSFMEDVERECERAVEIHPTPLHSAHEAYAVILEEVMELQAEVFNNGIRRSKARMYEELVQVGAMCRRMATDLDLVPRG